MGNSTYTGIGEFSCVDKMMSRSCDASLFEGSSCGGTTKTAATMVHLSLYEGSSSGDITKTSATMVHLSLIEGSSSGDITKTLRPWSTCRCLRVRHQAILPRQCDHGPLVLFDGSSPGDTTKTSATIFHLSLFEGSSSGDITMTAATMVHLSLVRHQARLPRQL